MRLFRSVGGWRTGAVGQWRQERMTRIENVRDPDIDGAFGEQSLRLCCGVIEKFVSA